MVEQDGSEELERLRVEAAQQGFDLTDDELRKVAPSVRRNRAYAANLRRVFNAIAEPAPVYDAADASGRDAS